MLLDIDHRELTAAEIEIVGGGKKINELKKQLEEARDTQSTAQGKGIGGAGALA